MIGIWWSERAIEDRMKCYTDPDYDWPAARERVSRIMCEYGATLPGQEDEGPESSREMNRT